ncbi:hypothetical protein [Sinomonas sp. P10A9]|uniref:FAR-17a/AIG1-like protein n=1 Tax=Sinomonas puerhi TaxID=3238584 RepID=A0AB39L9W2_9MICC
MSSQHIAAPRGDPGHARAFLVAAGVASVLVLHAKAGLDLFVPAAVVWAAASLAAARWTRGPASFTIVNIALLVADAGLDVLAMGEHLAPGTHGILPWRFEDGQGWVIAYWVALWGVAVPQRTLAMLRNGAAGQLDARLLFLAVIGLHACFVEDVVYFALLGYPPWSGPPPLGYAYLPALPGAEPWTPAGVWSVSAAATAFFIAVGGATTLRRARAVGRLRVGRG